MNDFMLEKSRPKGKDTKEKTKGKKKKEN